MFSVLFRKLHTISVDETIQVDGMAITGIKNTHGQLLLKVGPFSKIVVSGYEERIAWGVIGFNTPIDGKSIVNLGDTHLHEQEWQSIHNPDVLMISIGGKAAHNTEYVKKLCKS